MCANFTTIMLILTRARLIILIFDKMNPGVNLMRQFTYLLTSRLLSKEDERFEVVNYGLDALVSTTITTLVALFLAVLGDYWGEFITFGLVFIPIRCSYKSFHCSTFLHCLLFSNLLILFFSNILKFTNWHNYLVIVFLVINTLVLKTSRKQDLKLYMLINIIFVVALFVHKYLALTMVIAVLANLVIVFMDYLKRNGYMPKLFNYL